MNNFRLATRGLHENDIHKEALSTKDGEIVLSNPPVPGCPVQPVMKQVNTLDELKNLVSTSTGDSPQLLKSVSAAEDGALKALGSGHEGLSANQFDELKSAIKGFLNGQNTLKDDHKKNVEKAYGPFKVALYNVDNIEVYPGHNLIITGEQPSVVSINKIDLYPGGEIHISAPNVTIEIDEFEKHTGQHLTK